MHFFMAKTLLIKHNGNQFAAVPTKLERKKVYGWTELRATTSDGSICKQASLDSNGQTVIPKGGIKLGTLTDNGEWMDKSELIAVHPDGTAAEFFPSSFDSDIILDKKVSAEEFLNTVISAVYQLDIDNASELSSAIGSDIFSFKFSYRGDYDVSDAFLLSNGTTTYIFVGKPAQFEFIGLEEQGVIDEPDEEVEIDEDELDFSMM